MYRFQTYNILVFIVLILITGCSSNNQSEKKKTSNTKNTEVLKYAKGFTISDYGDYKKVTIMNPWQGAENVTYEYIITKDENFNKKFDNNFTVLHAPISRVICLSTSYIGFIDILNEEESIVALSGTDYANNPKVRDRIEKGEIKDIGYDNTLNFELIASLNPDLVITYGVGSQVASYNQKLNELGINTIIISEYLEDHPLGKLEWIKLIASLYGKEKQADEYFTKIEQEYNKLKQITSEIENKPNVLFGLPWKDVWYVPGGQSFLAKMVEDAGGNYIWASNDSRESIPLGIESVFSRASNADVWLNTGSVNSKADIVKSDKRFKEFIPFNNAKIYNNNLRVNQFGGNDYWEKGLVEPHIILKDMIKIFHPSILPDYELVYYKNIE